MRVPSRTVDLRKNITIKFAALLRPMLLSPCRKRQNKKFGGFKTMQKVVYSVSKVNKDEKLKGVGYLVGNDLLIPAISSKGNAYIRVFEDVVQKCNPVKDSDTEFKGYITVSYENVNVYNKEKQRYDTLDHVETTYYVWFKFVK